MPNRTGKHEAAGRQRSAPRRSSSVGSGSCRGTRTRRPRMISAEQHEHEREVERGEPRRVPVGERGEGRAARHDEPHLVAVPERTDRVDRDAALEVGLADDRVQHADAEVEALEDEEPRPEDGDDDEPDDLQAHRNPLVRQRRDGSSSDSGAALGRQSCSSSSPVPSALRPKRSISIAVDGGEQHVERDEEDEADPDLGRADRRRRRRPSVFIRPCTIQGWRPFSVSSHPAVFMRNGVTTAHIAASRNHFDVASLPRWSSHAPHSANSEHERAEVGHHAHRPVLDEHVRDVVAGPVLLLVLRVELVEADAPARSTLPVARIDSRCGISMIFVGVSSLLPPPIWNAENEHGWQVVPLRLGGRDLHRLVRGLDDAELAADDQLQQDRRHQHDERRPSLSGRTGSPRRCDEGATRTRRASRGEPVTSDGEEHVQRSPRRRPGS